MYSTEVFETYVKESGNRYIAIQRIAEDARELASLHDNKILISEALTWLSTGEQPRSLNKIEKVYNRRQSTTQQIIDDELECVDDTSVAMAVRNSISLSMNEKHLSYKYDLIDDLQRRARVRILANIIWYRITDIGSSHQYNS